MAKQLTMEAQKHHKRKTLTKAMHEERWNDALSEVESQLAADTQSVTSLRTKFKVLAVGKKDGDAARTCADALYDAVNGDAKALNKFAWALLTEDQYGGAYDDIGLRFSTRSNELSDHENWMFLDTLALAKFKTGDAEAAVELERSAIEKCKGNGKKELEGALVKFEKAAAGRKLAATTNTD